MVEISSTGVPTGMVAGAPRYVLHGLIGSGGMGVVHLGTMVSPAGERRVAIKRLHQQLDADAADRLVSEARMVFRLTHANICQVLDLAVSDEGTFVVMELVDGVDLHTLLELLARSEDKLDIANAVHIAREVAKALDYAHRRVDEKGQPLLLVHGDVTPKNILLSREGEVKLADFGIAQALGMHAPGNRVRGGTPGYIAPEAGIAAAHRRADIYALGVTLAVTLGATVPLELEPFSARHPEIPRDLVDILERATATRPEDRFASAGDLEQALAFWLARKFPQYTAARLADLVRHHATRRPNTIPAASSAEGQPLSHVTRSAALAEVDARGGVARGTRVAPVRSRSRYRLIGAAVALAAVALALAAVTLMRRPTKRVPDAPLRSPVQPMPSDPPQTVPPQVVPPSSNPPILPAPRKPARKRVFAPQEKEPSTAPKEKRAVPRDGLLRSPFSE